ncbi:hypothetical protein FKR81_14795 [Lentzea tibetensis]|uniref:Uncharacterized protein n=1 Tax=Lentzea tibetensis TaxID=2591470 RepID=A0A563EUT6_9PSEU|nr:hypothetical protein [Lentzea tibetensis]TWP51477.1 hypothetical protein FKR81_14795 [Lentzea tibetensis]
MNSTKTYPDGLDHLVLSAIEQQLSEEIASAAAPTSGLLDGSARERRNRRILARALAGVKTQYGVTLAQAVAQEAQQLRPASVASLPRAAGRVVRAEAA